MSKELIVEIAEINETFMIDVNSQAELVDYSELQSQSTFINLLAADKKLVLDDLQFDYENFRAGQLGNENFISPSLLIPLEQNFVSASDYKIGEIKIRVLEIEDPINQDNNVLDSNEFELRLTFNAEILIENGMYEIGTYPDERGVDARAYLIEAGGSIAQIKRNISNETLIYNQTNKSLTINFLDLIDDFSRASQIPLNKDDYYMIVEGLPLSLSSGEQVDTIEAVVTLI